MGKKNGVTVSSNKIVIQSDEKLVLGIDTHKNSYHCALWSVERQLVVEKWVQPADSVSMIKKLEPLAQHIRCAYYEAGPTGFELARRLMEHGFEVQVISPSHTPKAQQGPAKCDRLDACRLAEFGAKGMLRPVRIPSRQEEQRRQLTRTRQQIVKKRTCVKTQIRSFLLFYGLPEPQGLKSWSQKAVAALRSMKIDEQLRLILNLHLAELDHQCGQIKIIESGLKNLAEDPAVAPKFDLLRSIPYFGPITALTLLAEMPEPQRFSTSRQVSSYQSLAPHVESSGESRKQMGLDKGGSRILRTVLIEAAWRWVSHDTKAAAMYRHYLGKTGLKQKAIVAVARRLGIIAWRLLLTNEKYDSSRLAERG